MRDEGTLVVLLHLSTCHCVRKRGGGGGGGGGRGVNVCEEEGGIISDSCLTMCCTKDSQWQC